MRMQKQLAELSAAVASGQVVLPTADTTAWDRYRSQLHDVVRENLGYEAGKTLEFNRDSQEFYFTIEHYTVLEGFRCCCTSTFHFDPRKPLVAEFTRVQEEVEGFRRACLRAEWAAERAAEAAKAAAAAKAAV